MKKSVLLLGLLAVSAGFLTACNNSKNYEMSFEDALDVANTSKWEELLLNTENFQQNFNASAVVENEGTNISIKLDSSSKQNINDTKSESTTTFDVNIKDDEEISISGLLDLKLIDDVIYLNLESLNLTGSDDFGMMTAMLEGFKNRWFSIPMTGLSDVPNSFSTLKEFKESYDLRSQAKEIIINEGQSTYEGKFTQFNGYNAWKFSLDNEKLNNLLKEYLNVMNMTESEDEVIPELNIEDFEGYFVILGKNKVATVIENMKVVDEELNMDVSGFGGDDFKLDVTQDSDTVLNVYVEKKRSDYKVDVTIIDLASLKGTVTPKTSKSSIDVKFDITLDLPEDNISVPLKGSRKYKAISEFNIATPEDAEDLTELLGSYLGTSLGGEDYDYDYEDYDYDYEDYDEVENNIDEIVE